MAYNQSLEITRRGRGAPMSRRRFLTGAASAAALGGIAGVAPGLLRARAYGAVTAALPAPATAPIDHVVVLMMENRSFDHFLGWLPGADGRQAGLAFTNDAGTTYPTYNLAPDFQGCGYGDPDHSWPGGLVQLNGGKADGWLRTPKDRRADDTFPIGFYEADALPVLGALARNYTTLDRYFASILAETYPNRFYAHAARTDRDVNNTTFSTLPTIWDRLAAAGLEGRYYFNDLPILGLWGPKYVSLFRTFPQFLADAAAGTLPQLSFVDPAFNGVDVGTPSKVPPSLGDIANGEGDGTSGDDHPHGDIRAGEAVISQVYEAVRGSPAWDRTVFVINFDEWGGFFDHVLPPTVVDDTSRPPSWGPHPDYRQLGFRVPCIVISPFSPATVHHAGPFEHTSVLRMIEWRWSLPPLTARDANARNLAEVLDFSNRRTDTPSIPRPAPLPSIRCGPESVAAHPPTPLGTSAGAGPSGSAGAPGVGAGHAGTSSRPQVPATGGDELQRLGVGVAALGGAAGAAALRRRWSQTGQDGEDGEEDPATNRR
jgi:phospholipase C